MICQCSHSSAEHVLGAGECLQCNCAGFQRDDFLSFMEDYQECAEASRHPPLLELSGFEPSVRVKPKPRKKAS